MLWGPFSSVKQLLLGEKAFGEGKENHVQSRSQERSAPVADASWALRWCTCLDGAEIGDKIMLEPPHGGTLWFVLTRHQKQELSHLKACVPGATIK